MVALRDSPENIQLAERLVALYDAADAEVLLDVEVLEVSTARLTELGVSFPNTLSLTALPPSGATGLTLGNINGLTSDRIALGLGGAAVHLRREVGDFTTLASPRIRARSKEKAKIMIGDKIPVVSATTGQSGFVSDSISYLDVGVKLDVEPTVYANDEVGIQIALEVSTLGAAVRTTNGTLAYQIGTRNASTLLRLRDNETQMLAGLISKDDRSNAARLPGIGDLPVLGRLFSNQIDNSQRTELVLAVTPHVLRSLRRPNVGESEIWVGTEALPRFRPVGGIRAVPVSDSGPGGGASAAQVGVEEHEKHPPAPLTQWSWTGPSELKVGDMTEFDLKQDGNETLRGVALDIVFSRDKLQLLDAFEGDFYKQGGALTNFSRADDSKGGVLRAMILRNEATGATGQGTAMRLRFKALASGAAEVRVTGVRPVGLFAAPATPLRLPVIALQVR